MPAEASLVDLLRNSVGVVGDSTVDFEAVEGDIIQWLHRLLDLLGELALTPEPRENPFPPPEYPSFLPLPPYPAFELV